MNEARAVLKNGVLAAMLAMVGVYGIILHMVIRRRNKTAIRMAMGAKKGDILTMILREGVLLVGARLIVGSILTMRWAAWRKRCYLE